MERSGNGAGSGVYINRLERKAAFSPLTIRSGHEGDFGRLLFPVRNEAETLWPLLKVFIELGHFVSAWRIISSLPKLAVS